MHLHVFVTASEMQPVREAAFQPLLDQLNRHGRDIHLLVYDQEISPQVSWVQQVLKTISGQVVSLLCTRRSTPH